MNRALARTLQELLDRAVGDDPAVRNGVLRVDAPGLEWQGASVHYGLGVRRFVLGELGMPGFGELWGHTGFMKAFMLYWPERDVAICRTLNQAAARGVFSGLRPLAAIVPAVLRELRSSLGKSRR